MCGWRFSVVGLVHEDMNAKTVILIIARKSSKNV